jgi:Mg2+ and Co2+ transporter CorA
VKTQVNINNEGYVQAELTDRQMDELAEKIVDTMTDRIANFLGRLEDALNEQEKPEL